MKPFVLFYNYKPSLSTPSNMDRQILCHLFGQIICFVLRVSRCFIKQSVILAFFICTVWVLIKRKILVEKVFTINSWIFDGVERLEIRKTLLLDHKICCSFIKSLKLLDKITIKNLEELKFLPANLAKSLAENFCMHVLYFLLVGFPNS